MRKIKIVRYIDAPKGCDDCPLRHYMTNEGSFCRHPDAPEGYSAEIRLKSMSRNAHETPEWCPIREELTQPSDVFGVNFVVDDTMPPNEALLKTKTESVRIVLKDGNVS